MSDHEHNQEINMPPHDAWAHLYDFAYEQSFGAFYREFTELTLATIRELRQPPCDVVDFGAGTGRLSVPLAQSGYTVAAVEPSKAMLDVLLAKAAAANVTIKPYPDRLQDFEQPESFDLALCVFTTVSYLLDEQALQTGLTRLARSLRQDGRLLIDVPERALFQSNHRQTPVLDRQVNVTNLGGDRYNYDEKTRCFIDGQWTEYQDTFPIRYWDDQQVLTVLRELGIECKGPIPGFEQTASHYYAGIKAR